MRGRNKLALLVVLLSSMVSWSIAQDSTAAEDPEWVKNIQNALKKDTIIDLGNGLTMSNMPQDTSEQYAIKLARLGVAAKPYKDSVVVRWAPSDRELWLKGNQVGYNVYRIEITEDTTSTNMFQLNKTEHPVMPYDSAAWSKFLPISDPYAILASATTTGALEVSDGGPYGFLQKARSDNSKFGFALIAADHSKLAADGLGLRFVDTYQLKAGALYYYVVSLIDTTFPCINLPARVVYTGTNEPDRITNLEAISGDLGVHLKWPEEGNEGFTSYLIYRSGDGGITYDTITKTPYVPGSDERLLSSNDGFIHFYDTIPENYRPYEYLIYGNTPFADQSEVVKVMGMGKDLTPPINPVIHKGQVLPTGEIEVSWEEVEEFDSDFSHFNVLHSTSLDGEYRAVNEAPIMAPDTSYVYKPDGNTAISNYFRIEAYDTAGNSSRSYGLFVDIIDSIPPAVPVGLTGSIDTNGRVTIKWTANQEKDLDGYRVYFANNPDREFTQLTSAPLNAPQFIYKVSLKTLTEKIYFKVQAADRRHNHSGFSEVLEVKKPDTIAPVMPVIHVAKATNNSVKLTWEVSSSHDVEGHILWRRKKDELDYVKIADLGKADKKYEDKTAAVGVMYEYALSAYDDDNNSSELCFPTKGRVIDRKLKPSIASLKVSPSKKGAKISWDYDESGDYRFVILKGLKGSPLRTYKSLDGKTRSWEDAHFAEDGNYEYAVKVLYKGGYKSRLSDRVSFTFKKK